MVAKAKLYTKLDALEEELHSRLIPHLKRAAEGGNNWVFCVEGYHNFQGVKSHSDALTRELVEIGAEILALKNKLGEPAKGCPAERICWYCRAWGETGKRHVSSAQALAQQFLQELHSG